MSMEMFDLSGLSKLDNGRIAAAFDFALRRMEADVKDRPALRKARRVTLVVDMKPQCTDCGELESVDVSMAIKEAIPSRESINYNMQPVAGGLVFNEFSPDDAAQMTIDEVGPREVANAR